MTLRSRLAKVARHVNAHAGAGPLTSVLVEATAGAAPGCHRRTNGAGLPIVEIVFDPAAAAVGLPAPPYKLVCGVDPVALV